MTVYDNTNRGVLFKNKDKKTDAHPDYKGQQDVNGVEYWLSAWITKSKTGEVYLKFASTPKDERKDAPRGGGGGHKPITDDQIPFDPGFPTY